MIAKEISYRLPSTTFFSMHVEQQAETDALAGDNVHWGLLVAGVLGAALVVE